MVCSMAEGSSETSQLTDTSAENVETVNFRVVWKKTTYDVTFGLDEKAIKLKEHIQTLTGIPPTMMKLMYKGLVKDDKTLRELAVTANAKMMVVGSTMGDVMTVQPPSAAEIKKLQTEKPSDPKQSLSEAIDHKKILEKGVPEDIPPGIKHRNDPLPGQALSGMLNKYGNKVRLHFKKELDQLWIGTKERTEKLPLGSISNVLSEPIKGHEEYHIMALQLGPTELSRYWIYWVPAQYVEAVKDAILGKWQLF
ncbi:ubiquitin domain-containing protein UBFD1-like [Halichondria panicea]|uniref:ubiquitin domain-containing protein UBFD1-like n=1 Tax=Halichondria panicea TaxID=6063 RepID=UPI00312B3B2C